MSETNRRPSALRATAAPRLAMLAMDLREDYKKEQILDRGGYRYYIHGRSYVNLEKKKIFSMQWIDAHSPRSLAEKVVEPNASGDWQFYFTEEPSRYVRELLTSELAAIDIARPSTVNRQPST